jgi:D-erythro-7,8-dihydroneopterin triphosphate epimerase
MATVEIVDLRIRTLIGTKSWERKNKQEILINLTLTYDATKASLSDKLSDALDYEQITNDLIKTVEGSRCLLLEKLADKILGKLKSYKRLQAATLRIDKPQAIPQARHISYRVNL